MHPKLALTLCTLLMAGSSQNTKIPDFLSCLDKATGELGSENHKVTEAAFFRWTPGGSTNHHRLSTDEVARLHGFFAKHLKSKSSLQQFYALRGLLVLARSGYRMEPPLWALEHHIRSSEPPVANQALFLSVTLQPENLKQGWNLNRLLSRLEKRYRDDPRVRHMIAAGRFRLMEDLATLRKPEKKTLGNGKRVSQSTPVSQSRNTMQRSISDNESAAIALLKNLSSSQAQAQASGAIDANRNGAGEYGFLQELAGTHVIRGPDNKVRAKGKVYPSKKMKPPVLAPHFGKTDKDGCVSYKGYYIRVYLSGAKGRPVHEFGPQDPLPSVRASYAEICWCAYAWPIERGISGNRCFFVSNGGDVLSSSSGLMGYSGKDRIPIPKAAYFIRTDAKDVLISKIGVLNCAFDGGRWTVIG